MANPKGTPCFLWWVFFVSFGFVLTFYFCLIGFSLVLIFFVVVLVAFRKNTMFAG